jgi:hypothetical protein
MKRAIIASILGLAASVAVVSQTQAQGTVFFANYSNGGQLQAPVTFSGASQNGLSNGELVGTGGPGANFTATLLYSFGPNLGTTFTDAGVTASFIAANGDAANGAGLFGFAANTVTIPGYSSGNIDFIVDVFNGSSFANSSIRGQSAVVTLNNLATAANSLPTASLLSDNAAATTPLTAFTVQAVPEPGIFALAGLGAAALMAIRRKK